MSSMSLEERRAERRRKREMDAGDNEPMKTLDHEEAAHTQDWLAQRRRQREERMAAISSNLVAVNGEDDLERRRRERREARLRGKPEASTDDTSGYSSRRRESQEEEPAEQDSFSSYRARRRRNWGTDEETPTVSDTPSVSDTSAAEEMAAERRRRQQEEEEEARRQREREEEEEHVRAAEVELEERQQQQQEEEEERRQREQEQEEERRRQEEDEARRRQVEQERQTQGRDQEEQHDEDYDKEYARNKLYLEQHSLQGSKASADILKSKVKASEKLDRVRRWNEDSNYNFSNKGVEKQTVCPSNVGGNKSSGEVDNKSDTVLVRSSSIKEINNNNIRDKLEKFEHPKGGDSLKVTTTTVIVGKATNPTKRGLKEKLQKFEQDSPSHSKPTPKKQLAGFTPASRRLSHKLQQFETAARTTHSASKASSKTIQFELERFGGNRDDRQAILGRWSASETQISQQSTANDPPPTRTILERWKSIDQQETKSVKPPHTKKEPSTKRLSGNVEFVTSRYLEKTRSVEETAPTPNSPRSPGVCQQNYVATLGTARNTSQSSDNQSEFSEHLSPNQSRSKVTDRWQFGAEADKGTGQNVSIPHNKRSSVDEEEERLEAARQEKERARMAEESRKRGKKKGLGGLTPEKKKKLKDMLVDYDTEEEEEKVRALHDRMPALPQDIDYLSTAELRKLCKTLHDRLAQIHSEVYDWEYKVGKQEQEITELTMKVNDTKGKLKLYRNHLTIEENPQTLEHARTER